MDWLLQLRPIRFFSFYLALVFVLGVWRRWQQYRTILALVVRFSSRWPNLTRLVLAHRHLFLTWGTLKPLIVAAALMLGNTLASVLVWPETDKFRVSDLVEIWPALILVAVTGTALVSFDVYGMLLVSEIQQTSVEVQLDQAEYWLRGWKAPVVRVLSLGYVNPRQMVTKEVRTALEGTAQLLNASLWWTTVQTALRIAFGLSLWISYALNGWLHRLLA